MTIPWFEKLDYERRANKSKLIKDDGCQTVVEELNGRGREVESQEQGIKRVTWDSKGECLEDCERDPQNHWAFCFTWCQLLERVNDQPHFLDIRCRYNIRENETGHNDLLDDKGAIWGHWFEIGAVIDRAKG